MDVGCRRGASKYCLAALAALVLAVAAQAGPENTAVTSPAVTIAPLREGLEITAPAYRARLGADGNLHSLIVGDTELLEDKVSISRGAFLYADEPKPLPTISSPGPDQVVATDGSYSISYHFRPNEIELRLRQTATPVALFFVVVSERVRTAKNLRPADPQQQEVSSVPTEQPWGDVQFTADSGAYVALHGGSRIWGPWSGREIWELTRLEKGQEYRVTFTMGEAPPPAPTLRQLLGLQVLVQNPDHLVPSGSGPEFSLTLDNRAEQPVRAEAMMRLTAPNGAVTAESFQAVTLEPKASTSMSMRLGPGTLERPDFYRAQISLVVDGQEVKQAEAVIGYAVESISEKPYPPPDFDEFWSRTMTEARGTPLEAAVTRDAARSNDWVQVYAATFRGFGGATVRGWYCTPAMPGRYPGLLLLPGYASPPAEPPSVLAGKGYAVLAIAVQGEPGAAPVAATGSYVTTGIGDAQTYVYRQIVGHVVRAFDFLAERPEVDPGRIAVTGPGEGGGLALILAALEPRVAAVMSDVPFLADFPRSIGRGGWPYLEIADYIKASPDREAAVRRTLSYFDAVNFAARVRAPVFMSVGLRDTACRPETAYAVFNALAGPKQMKVYPDAGHEGGGAAHWLAKLDWLGRVLAAPPAGTPQ